MLLLLSSIEKILNPAFYLDKITMSFEVDFFFLKYTFCIEIIRDSQEGAKIVERSYVLFIQFYPKEWLHFT